MVGSVSCLSGEGFSGDAGFVGSRGEVKGVGVCGVEHQGEREGEGEKEVLRIAFTVFHSPFYSVSYLVFISKPIHETLLWVVTMS